MANDWTLATGAQEHLDEHRHFDAATFGAAPGSLGPGTLLGIDQSGDNKLKLLSPKQFARDFTRIGATNFRVDWATAGGGSGMCFSPVQAPVFLGVSDDDGEGADGVYRLWGYEIDDLENPMAGATRRVRYTGTWGTDTEAIFPILINNIWHLAMWANSNNRIDFWVFPTITLGQADQVVALGAPVGSWTPTNGINTGNCESLDYDPDLDQIFAIANRGAGTDDNDNDRELWRSEAGWKTSTLGSLPSTTMVQVNNGAFVTRPEGSSPMPNANGDMAFVNQYILAVAGVATNTAPSPDVDNDTVMLFIRQPDQTWDQKFAGAGPFYPDAELGHTSRVNEHIAVNKDYGFMIVGPESNSGTSSLVEYQFAGESPVGAITHMGMQSVDLNEELGIVSGDGQAHGQAIKDYIEALTVPKTMHIGGTVYWGTQQLSILMPADARHSILTGKIQGRPPVAETGNTGKTNADILPCTFVFDTGPGASQSEFFPLTLEWDNGGGGNTWKSGGIKHIAFAVVNATADNDMPSAFIRLRRGISLLFDSLAFWDLSKPQGANGRILQTTTGRDLGGVSFFIDPAQADAVQYLEFRNCTWSGQNDGYFTGVASRGNLLTQDYLFKDCYGYNTPKSAPDAGSCLWDSFMMNDSDWDGGAVQFADDLFRVDSQLVHIRPRTMEQSSGWAVGAGNSFVHLLANADQCYIDGRKYVNTNRCADVIRVDAGVTNSECGIAFGNHTARRWPTTTDNVGDTLHWYDPLRDGARPTYVGAMP